jgi:hypothetical protein
MPSRSNGLTRASLWQFEYKSTQLLNDTIADRNPISINPAGEMTPYLIRKEAEV